MITVLLGPDSYTKQEYVRDLASQLKAELAVFRSGDQTPDVHELSEQNLFSKPKVFVLQGLIEKFAEYEAIWERLKKSSNHVVFVEEKLDKRTGWAKSLVKDKNITTQVFTLPHGKDLNKWITKRVQELQGEMGPKAIELLAKKVGRDGTVETKFGGKVVEVREVFDLWRVNSEIEKLLAAAGDEPVDEQLVEELVFEAKEVDALAIVNAIGEGKKILTLQMVQGFLGAESGGDEKAGVIQLNALLADQFRNILITQGFAKQGLPESAVLEKTGWKSGRLFVMKKISARFPEQKVRNLLGKLEHLDTELKTSSTPPQVLLNLILAQLF